MFEVVLEPLPGIEYASGDEELVQVSVGALKAAVLSDDARLALLRRRETEVALANDVAGAYNELYADYAKAWREINLWRIFGGVSVGAGITATVLVLLLGAK